MACEAVWTDSARSDVEGIAEYLGTVLANKQAVRNFLATLRSVIDNIEDMPEMYPVSCHRPLERRGIRAARVGRYILLYRVDADAAYIFHVFHQTQDYTRLV